jgi:hypothetical protein
MEMWMIAALLGLSLALILTAKIAKALDTHYKTFLWLGVLCCVAAGAPLILSIIPKARDLDSLHNSESKRGPRVPSLVGVLCSAHRRFGPNCRFHIEIGCHTPVCACKETRKRPRCTNS